MMKFITEINGKTYAANNEGEGVFELRGGAYSQHRGTGQTPKFKTLAAFRKYVLKMLSPVEQD